MSVDLGRDLVQRPLAGRQEVGLEQQVLGRIAVDRQLGEHGQLRAAPRARGRAQSTILRGVAVDVADGGVDLGQGDAQRAVHVSHAQIL